MFTDTPELDLAVSHTDVVARRSNGGGAGERAPGTHGETRAVPGAGNYIAIERALIERPTGMATGGTDGGILLPQAEEHHRHAGMAAGRKSVRHLGITRPS